MQFCIESELEDFNLSFSLFQYLAKRNIAAFGTASTKVKRPSKKNRNRSKGQDIGLKKRNISMKK